MSPPCHEIPGEGLLDRRTRMTCFSFDILNRGTGTASGFRRLIRCHYPAPSPNVSIMTPTRSCTLSFPEVPPFEVKVRRQCPRCLHQGEPVVVPRGCTFGDAATQEKASLVRLRFQPHPIQLPALRRQRAYGLGRCQYSSRQLRPPGNLACTGVFLSRRTGRTPWGTTVQSHTNIGLTPHASFHFGTQHRTLMSVRYVSPLMQGGDLISIGVPEPIFDENFSVRALQISDISSTLIKSRFASFYEYITRHFHSRLLTSSHLSF